MVFPQNAVARIVQKVRNFLGFYGKNVNQLRIIVEEVVMQSGTKTEFRTFIWPWIAGRACIASF